MKLPSAISSAFDALLSRLGRFSGAKTELTAPKSPLVSEQQFEQPVATHQIGIAIENFVLALKDNHCSESTVRNYRSDINQFAAFAGVKTVSELLTKPKLLAFQTAQLEKGLREASVKRKFSSLTQFAQWAVQHGVLSSEPAWVRELSLTGKLQPESNATLLPSSFGTPVSSPSTEATKAHVSETPVADPLAQFAATPTVAIKPAITARRRWLPTSFWAGFNAAILIIFLSGLGYFGYRQWFVEVSQPLAFPTAPVRPNRFLSFQGRLSDTAQTPISTATNMNFKLFDSGPSTSGGTELWTSGTCSITPDQDGIFSAVLGSSCGSEIDEAVFSENANVWLQVTVGAEVLSPRQPIAAVGYALNSETLQGFPIGTSGVATANTVIVMDNNGDILLGEASPKIDSSSGTFTIEGQTLQFQTGSGSNGSIIFDADGTGGLISNDYFYAPGATLSATYAGGVPLTAKGGPSGTGNLTDWRNAANTLLAYVTAAGNVVTNSTLGIAADEDLLSLAANALTVNGSGLFTSDVTLNSQSDLRLADADSSNYLAFQAPAVVGSNLTYTFPGTVTNGYILSTDGSGTLSWADPAVLTAGSNYWIEGAGILYPKNSTVDFFVGGVATNSAKFAVLNVNSGTPTASVSAGTSGAAYLTAAGTLQTTQNQNLTLGGNTTGSIFLLPRNSTGRVGINTTTPVGAFDVKSTNTNTFPFNVTASDGSALLDLMEDSSGNGLLTIRDAAGTSQAEFYTFSNAGNLILKDAGTTDIFLAGSGDSYFNAGRVSFGKTTALSTSTVDILGNLNTFGSATVSASAAGSKGLVVRGATGQTANLQEWQNVGGSVLAYVDASGNLNLASGNAYQINGSSVLNATTLGSSVVNSSLTGVGALSSGSIASGFGTIATTNTITGTTLNGTTGINTGAGAGTQRITSGGNLVNIGTTQIGGVTYTWPGADGSSNQALTTNGSGTLSWSSVLTDSGVVWTSGLGSIYPKNSTMDLLVGGQATASAKFAVLNLNTGTPTASLSGQTGDRSLVLFGDGQIGTTSRGNLTLGNSSGRNTTGNILLQSNGQNYVGIGTTTPGSILDVATGQVRVPDGSVLTGGNPGLAFTTFPDTGIAANHQNFGIWESGTLALNLTDSFKEYRVPSNYSFGFSSATDNNSNSDTTFYRSSAGVIGTAGLLTTGNIDINGTSNDIAGTLNLSGGALTSTGDLTITPAGNNVLFGNDVTLNVGGAAAAAYNFFAGSTAGVSTPDSDNDLYIEDELEVDGTTRFGNVTYTWPGADGILGQFLTTDGSGALSWTSGGGGGGYFSILNGALYPVNLSLDFLLGGTATSSSKFAVLNMNSGTPNASISGQTSNRSLVLYGDGQVSSTNRGDITIGNSSGRNTSGNILLQSNAQNRVGIGTTNPGSILDVATGQLRGPDGSVIAGNGPGIAFTSYSDTGIAANSQNIGIWESGTLALNLTDTLKEFRVPSNYTFAFSAATNNNSGSDTSISRSSAGVISTANLLLTGGALTASGDLTITPAGGNVLFGNNVTLNVGGATAAAYNFFAGSTAGVSTPDSDNDLYIEDELEVDGTTRFGNLTYTWPTSQTANYVLQTNGSGTLSWADSSTLSDTYWNITSGALHQKNTTTDFLIGGTATNSAKFAVLNVNSGTPTASVSAGAAGASYISATGTLATTAMQNLVLGAATTGDIALAPAGTTAVSVLRTSGNVGINKATPTAKLDLIGDFNVLGAATVSASYAGGRALSVVGNSGTTVTDALQEWKVNTTQVGYVDHAGYIYAQRFADFANDKYYLDPSASPVALQISGSAGIGKAVSGPSVLTPDAKLEVLEGTGTDQLRLTYTEDSAYTTFNTSSAGDLTITPTGGDLNVVGKVNATQANIGGGSDPAGNFISAVTGTVNYNASGTNGVVVNNTLNGNGGLLASGNLNGLLIQNTITNASGDFSYYYGINVDTPTGTASEGNVGIRVGSGFNTGIQVVSGGINSTGSFITSGNQVFINQSSNFTTSINTGTSTGAITLGGGLNDVIINSDTWDVDSAGAITGLTGLTNNGNTTLGDAGADTVTFNASVISVTNGLNIDSGTLYIDSTNNKVTVGSTNGTVGTKFKIEADGTNTTQLQLTNGTGDVQFLGSSTGDLTISPEGSDIIMDGRLSLNTGFDYRINNTSVLNATTLGSGVTTSSLTSVGTLGSLTVTNNINTTAGALQLNSTTRITNAGLFQAAAGTNSAPSLSFSGDTDTGIYASTADVLSFTVGGSNTVSVNNWGLQLSDSPASGATCDAAHDRTITYDRNAASIGRIYLCRQTGTNGNYGWREIDTATVSSPDLAEYAWASDMSLNGGDIVSVTNPDEDRENFYDRFNIVRASSNASKKVLGVVSSDPGIILNKPEMTQLGQEVDPHLKPLTLAGRVPVKVVTSTPLNQGDRIGLSADLPGIGARLTGSGFSVGTVLTSFNPSAASCTNISSPSEATWPNSNKDECYQLPDGRILAKVLVLVNNEYSLADSSLQEDGSFTLGGTTGTALKIVDELGIETAFVTSSGDASFTSVTTPELSSESITTESLLVTEDAQVDGTLNAQSARISTLQAIGLTADSASVSGTLYADRLVGNISADSIEGLQARISALVAAETASMSAALSPDEPTQGNIETLTAGGSALELVTLPNDVLIQGLLQAEGGIITSTLLVDSTSYAKNSLSFVTEPSCDPETGCNSFAFQPSGAGTLTFLNNLVVMSNGTVAINGDLSVTGTIAAEAVRTDRLIAQGEDLTIDLASASAEVSGGSVLGSLIIRGVDGQEVANYSAEGSSRFQRLALESQNAVQDATNEDQSEQLEAGSGTAVLKAGKTEYKIRTTAAKADSLIYLTATSATGTKTLYVKAQGDNEFTVGLDGDAHEADISLNWWVVGR